MIRHRDTTDHKVLLAPTDKGQVYGMDADCIHPKDLIKVVNIPERY